ncbi:pyridoxal 5'-phosphate synthase glutaminase subunit PdxT [Methanocalculus sp.]|uniref:pyridoxal 5'-phosphate synthase glutaminase subunit PdxT n=1 Tax=Methanocalculus sp. TaxID=2004547 RepID=UPI00271F9D0C|nr:pyridoxal 5'-phosphate synthase glutaminase subunit PdxT [Methanocalculus sp.]MDO8841639.1 pyridoxal 5'-phosphate synthase glutaminase subunit PdxT [Methanocalculus sp.]
MAGRIGVLALQGDVSEHALAFTRALGEKGEVSLFRDASDIPTFDGIALPGGESTTIMRLIHKAGMQRPLQQYEGGIFATCAGMVLLASEVQDDSLFEPLGIMDMTVKRNAFGRQRESFEADIECNGLSSPFHAIFIRAPVATRVGYGTEVLASVPQGYVAVRHGLHMAFAFHPELGGDLRFHRLFLERLGL